jgi:hypothetical protein
MQELYRVLKPGRNGTNSQDWTVTFADDDITDQKNVLKYLVSTTMYAFRRYFLINYEASVLP